MNRRGVVSAGLGVAVLVIAWLLVARSAASTADPVSMRQVGRRPAASVPTVRVTTSAPIVVPQDRPAIGPERAKGSDSDALPGRLVARCEMRHVATAIELALVRVDRAGLTDEGSPSVRLGGDGESYRVLDSPVGPTQRLPCEWWWDELEPGAWMLVTPPGSGWVVRGPSALPIQVRSDVTREVFVEFAQAGVLRGRVASAGGRAVLGARVRVVGPLPEGVDLATVDTGDVIGAQVHLARTDDVGEFEISGVPLGTIYAAHAWTADGIRATGRLVARGADSEPALLVGTSPATIVVMVRTGEEGRPVADARVMVTDHGLARLEGVRRDDLPMSILREAAPTDASGRTSIPAEVGAWISVVAEAFDVETCQVSEGVAALGSLEVALDDPARPIVRVTTPDGRPVAGAEVEAAVAGLRDRHGVEITLASATSDSRGELPLSAFGDLPAVGSLRIFGRHPQAGLGGLQLDLGALEGEARGLAKVLVLRPPGALQIDVARSGWATPTPSAYDARLGVDDRAERDAADHIMVATLHYLGSNGLRMEISAQQGRREMVDLDAWLGGLPRAIFEDLEPGSYAVELVSRARGIALVTPALLVHPGETTHYAIEAPDPHVHGRITLAVDATSADSGAFAILVPEGGPVFRGATPGILPPAAAASDRRAGLGAHGLALFDLVPPGRYVVGLGLPAADGRRAWHQTPVFEVGPGDELRFDELTAQEPPPGIVFY